MSNIYYQVVEYTGGCQGSRTSGRGGRTTEYTTVYHTPTHPLLPLTAAAEQGPAPTTGEPAHLLIAHRHTPQPGAIYSAP